MSAETVALVRPLLADAPRSTRTVIRRLAALVPKGEGQLRHAIADERLMRDTGLSEASVRRARRWGVAAGIFEATSGIGHRATRYTWRLIAQSGHESGQDEHVHGSSRAPQESMRNAVLAVQKARPDWHAAGIAWTLVRARRKGASLRRALEALLAAAADPSTKSPARVLCDGWWWDQADPRRSALVVPLQRSVEPSESALCPEQPDVGLPASQCPFCRTGRRHP